MKRKYTIIILIIVLFTLALLTHKTTIVFDKLVETEINTLEYNFGKITQNDTINYTFTIKNISDYSFVITEVLPSCTCTITNTETNKVYQKNEIAKIETQFIPKKNQKGMVENIILVACNSNNGVIKLKLKGTIISN